MFYRMSSNASGALAHVLRLDGAEFIEAAFKMLLGRSADPGALDHYGRQLNKNNNKMQVLSDILSSREAGSRAQDLAVVQEIVRYQKRKMWLWPFVYYYKRGSGSREGISQGHRHSLRQEIPGSIGSLEYDQFNRDISEKLQQLNSLVSRLDYKLSRSTSDSNRKCLGADRQRFLVNLSTSNFWRSHAVGIVRVERELARYLCDFSNVEFVVWHPDSQSLRFLEPYQAQMILTDDWCKPGGGMASFDPARLAEQPLTQDDTYISVGLDWDHSPSPDVLKYLRRSGAKSIFACHDVVPVKFPEFLVREELGQEFKHHLLEMAHGATKVLAVSESSKRDLLAFWNDAGIEAALPDIFVSPLASYSALSALPSLTPDEEARMRDLFRQGEYVLYVSSFEPRKNHKMLIDIWRELWRDRKENCPQLVCVGMSGWGSGDLLNRIPRMSAFVNGKIRILQGIGDNLLAHLYANCVFTVFPSLYEGWGLSATESMSFGKASIVSNNSSLPQATQDLMPALHPLDFLNWKREIVRLLDDVEYRSGLESAIKYKYKHRSWSDFGKDFCAHLVPERQA